MKVGIITHSLEAADPVLKKQAFFDALELRIDTFIGDPFSLIDSIQKEAEKPLIFTLRSIAHGGNYRGDPYFLLKLAALRPHYLDVECDLPEDIYAQIPSDVVCISSYHNFESTPENLEKIVERVQKRPAERYKIACMPHSANDVMRLLEVAAKYERMTCIAMGEDGAFSRIIAPIFGNMLQFIAVSHHSAPGQCFLEELLQIYNYTRISSRTRVYALLGDPVDKSYSNITHNKVFNQLQLDAVFVKICVQKEILSEFLQRAERLPFYGFSLTMPLKRHFSFDPVNTLKRSAGHWKTRNTDGVGALNAIERACKVQEKTILILGAGGVSHAIAAEALQRGAHVKIANRTPEKAHALAQHLGDGCIGGSLSDHTFCGQYDIIVNGTSVGMGEADSPISPSWILPGTVAMDCVSNPKRTPFLRDAEKMDCTLIYGIDMFVLQAVEQFLFWFPDIAHEKAGIERILRNAMPQN